MVDSGASLTVGSRKPKWALAGLSLLLVANGLAFNHAWSFAHFSRAETRRGRPETLSLADRAAVLTTGVALPRPENTRFPSGSGGGTRIPFDGPIFERLTESTYDPAVYVDGVPWW